MFFSVSSAELLAEHDLKALDQFRPVLDQFQHPPSIETRHKPVDTMSTIHGAIPLEPAALGKHSVTRLALSPAKLESLYVILWFPGREFTCSLTSNGRPDQYERTFEFHFTRPVMRSLT